MLLLKLHAGLRDHATRSEPDTIVQWGATMGADQHLHGFVSK